MQIVDSNFFAIPDGMQRIVHMFPLRMSQIHRSRLKKEEKMIWKMQWMPLEFSPFELIWIELNCECKRSTVFSFQLDWTS